MVRKRRDSCTVVEAEARAVSSRPTGVALPAGAPASFRWRGRSYTVVAAQDFWIESGAWWTRSRGALQAVGESADGSTAPAGIAVLGNSEREVWRVEATAGRRRAHRAIGVYDLVHEPATGRWWLARVWD